MSTLKTGALRGTSGTADSVQLHASDQSVTFPGAVTHSGDVNHTGNIKPTTRTNSSRPADPTDGTIIYNSDEIEMQYFTDDGGWRNFDQKGSDIKTIIDSIGGDASTYLHWCCDANGAGNSASTVKDLSGNGWDGSNTNMGFTAKSGSTGGYWTYNADSGDSYSNLGTQLGSNIANSDSQYAVCAWVYVSNFEDINGNRYWILNDGDWGPDGQIGFRIQENATSGTSGVRCAAGDDSFNTSDNLSTGWPTGAGWAFVYAVRSGSSFSGANRVHQMGRAFPSDTNINTFHSSETTFSAHDASNNMIIGARPDSLSEDNTQGDKLGLMALWLRTGGSGMSTPTTWFETIFDKTKGRYT